MAALVVVTPATLYIIPSLSSGVAFSPSHSSLSYPERNGESKKRKEKKSDTKENIYRSRSATEASEGLR
jgi:hypothetical protein